jgi:hypothetical protein
MSDSVDISHLITVGVALCGWLAVHRFSSWRDRINHKRKMQTDFLVTAFQHLANSANRPFAPGAEHLNDMESALADIQLFGSKKQVQLVENFATEFAKASSASLDPLLNSLRQDLRKELGYEQINSNVKWVRFEGGVTPPQHHVPGDLAHKAAQVA